MTQENFKYANDTGMKIEAARKTLSPLKDKSTEVKAADKLINDKWAETKYKLENIKKLDAKGYLSEDVKVKLNLIDDKYSKMINAIKIKGEKDKTVLGEKLDHLVHAVKEFSSEVALSHENVKNNAKNALKERGDANIKKLSTKTMENFSMSPTNALAMYTDGAINIAKATAKETGNLFASAVDNLVVVPAKFWAEVAIAGAGKSVEFVKACYNRGVTVPVAFWKETAKRGADHMIVIANLAKAKGIKLNNKFWDGALIVASKMGKEGTKVYIQASGDITLTAFQFKEFFANVKQTKNEMIASYKAAGVVISKQLMKNMDDGFIKAYEKERNANIQNIDK